MKTKNCLFGATLNFKFINLCFVFLISQNLLAQSNLWQRVGNEPTTFGVKQVNPNQYKIFKLEIGLLKSFLNGIPLELTANSQNPDNVLQIPLPDGTFMDFMVSESPIMEAELAKKYPEIKTYSAYSIDNGAITARLDFTPKGFHAMIFSTDGTYFIDPYNSATTEFYICYDKKDFVSKKSFTCGVDNLKENSIDNPNIQNQYKTINVPRDTKAALGDGVLRHYRLALAATGEYTTFHGGTVALALAAQVTTMNRVNGVFLKDLGVKMNIIANNNLIIYTNGASDPYTNDDGFEMLDENITNLSTTIGNANFDIGHVFSTGGGGVAYTPSVCDASFKAGGVTGSGSPVGDPFDIDYVAHEIGHQFGGNHSQNNSCQRNSSTAFEPGSGHSIMGYAGICSPDVQSNSDAFFHAGNLGEMHAFITEGGNSCSTKPSHTNAAPTITSNTSSQTIPKGTPFMLSATANDANGNGSLTYSWDQMDTQVATQPPVSSSTGGPSFRGFLPSGSGTRYFPRLSDLTANNSPTWEVLPTVARNLNFRLVVRDNATNGGANDRVDIVLTVEGTAGPFVVTAPNTTGISFVGFSSQTINWTVAGTTAAPINCTNVDILLSTDGGFTYPTTLASNVPNSGSALVTIPNITTTTARIMVKGTGRAFFDISNHNFSISGCTTPSIPTSVAVNKTYLCTGNSVSLSANCASGTVKWYDVASGSSALGTGTGFTQSPVNNITYYAACENGTCKSSRVATGQVIVAPTNNNISTNQSAGTVLYPAAQAITANNKVLAPANATYRAGNSVSLNAGFEVKNGATFLAQIQGCN